MNYFFILLYFLFLSFMLHVLAAFSPTDLKNVTAFQGVGVEDLFLNWYES